MKNLIQFFSCSSSVYLFMYKTSHVSIYNLNLRKIYNNSLFSTSKVGIDSLFIFLKLFTNFSFRVVWLCGVQYNVWLTWFRYIYLLLYTFWSRLRYRQFFFVYRMSLDASVYVRFTYREAVLFSIPFTSIKKIARLHSENAPAI